MTAPDERQVARVLAARAAELSRPAADQQEESLTVLVLEVCGQQVAVPVTDVREVQPPGHVAQLPGSSATLPGLTGGRGEPLAVASLSALLGLTSAVPHEQQWVAVLEHPTAPLGLLADALVDVVPLPRTSLTPPTDPGGLVSALVRDGPIVLSADALLRDPRLSFDPPTPAEEPS